MNTPYLIQRAKFEKNSGKGIDSILSFDYMGSAEFEWGALPKSLDRIRKNIDHFTTFDTVIKGKEFTVFTDQNVDQIIEILKDLAKDKIRLKEFSDFKSYVDPSEYDLKWQKTRSHETDFWWDIENDFMFWKKDKDFESKFKTLISVKPQ